MRSNRLKYFDKEDYALIYHLIAKKKPSVRQYNVQKEAHCKNRLKFDFNSEKKQVECILIRDGRKEEAFSLLELENNLNLVEDTEENKRALIEAGKLIKAEYCRKI